MCCSLKWLSGVIAVNTLQDDTHSLLLEPYENGILKSNVIGSLTNPNLYLSAYGVLFPDEHVKNGSFESLIHSLARRGGYVLEDNDVIVTDSMLSQENPFREVNTGYIYMYNIKGVRRCPLDEYSEVGFLLSSSPSV